MVGSPHLHFEVSLAPFSLLEMKQISAAKLHTAYSGEYTSMSTFEWLKMMLFTLITFPPTSLWMQIEFHVTAFKTLMSMMEIIMMRSHVESVCIRVDYPSCLCGLI